MAHPTFGIEVDLTGLTFPIPEEGQGQKKPTWKPPCWAAPHAAHTAQPGQHVPSPRAAGASPAQRSRDAQPPSDGCLGPCGKPVGLIQVLAGRYPCVSESLPARTGLGGCQARAGRGPLRSAGTSQHLPRAQASLAPCKKLLLPFGGCSFIPFPCSSSKGNGTESPK